MKKTAQFRLSILACIIAASVWAVALINVHSFAVQSRDHATADDQGLDESRISARPIAYPVLETASFQSSQPLVTFTSERGQFQVRCVSKDQDVAKSLEFLTGIGTGQISYPLSTQPVPSLGALVWQGNLRQKKAIFRTITTDHKVVISDDNSRVLWRLTAPRAEYSLNVDAAERAQLINRSGKQVWRGTLAQPISGYSLTGTSGTANLNLGPLKLSVSPYGMHLVVAAGHEGWSGPTAPNIAMLRINSPGFRRVLAIRTGVACGPAFVAWAPDVSTRSTISTSSGSVTARESHNGHHCTQVVEIGSMVTVQPPTKHTLDAGLLVTPVAPYYVDHDPITATYRDHNGAAVAVETIVYEKTSFTPGAMVTRKLHTLLRRGTSSTTTTYTAPIKPASTNWAP